VNDRRLCSALAVLLLVPALAVRAADKEAAPEPLPAGAKARLGVSRSAVLGYRHSYGAYLLPPDFRTYLLGGGGTNGPRLCDALTGTETEVPGFEPADPSKPRSAGKTIFAVSSDGKRAVTERAEGAYLVFEIATGKALCTVKAPTAPLGNFSREMSPVALSADGKVLAFDAPGKAPAHDAVVWDVEKNQQLARVPVRTTRSALLLSPDGTTLATFGFHEARNSAPDEVNPGSALLLWDVATGKLRATIPDAFTNFSHGSTVAFSPDGKTLATTEASGGMIRLWEATTGKAGPVLLARAEQGIRLAFSPDGKTLASLGHKGAIERWALPDGRPLKQTTFSPTDLMTFGMHPWTLGLAFADNERVVVWGALRQTMLLWEAPSGKLFPPVAGHLGGINGVRFTADSKGVVTIGEDLRVLRWDPGTGKHSAVAGVSPQERSPYTRLAPGGTRAMRWGTFCDLTTGEELFALPGNAPMPSDDYRRAATFRVPSPSATKPTPIGCEVWDLENRRRLARLELPPAPESSMAQCSAAFSPDNGRLVTMVQSHERPGGGGMTLTLTGWEVATGKKLAELREPMPVLDRFEDSRVYAAVVDNSTMVLTTADGKLWVADFEKGTRRETLGEHTRLAHRFTHPTFSPDRKLFAVGVPVDRGLAYGVRVYSWPGGKALHTFTGHRAPITALSFSADGKTLASGSADTTVLLWDLSAIEKPK
jgi:WD40 repeat protein